MSLISTIQDPTPSSKSDVQPAAAQPERSPDKLDDPRLGVWVARIAIVTAACGMAWYTWGHWGDFQIDCGREIYVPVAILRSKLLFRDIWYMYGPLAPYLQALLFRLFGVHLTVLYVFGLVLTATAAVLLFEIARQLRLALVTSVVPALFLLSESFYPFIFNFVFPYSYAASLAVILGLGCLYFALRYIREGRTRHLAVAAALAGLVVLTKQEFGFACVLLLCVPISASFVARRSRHDLTKNIGICFAGLMPAIAVYEWFAWKVGTRTLFVDNWISTPGTYFMRVYGKLTMANQGFRFSVGEFLNVAEFTLLAVALWSTLASLNVLVIRRLRVRWRWGIAIAVALNAIPIAMILNTAWASKVLLAPIGRVIRPSSFSMMDVFVAVQDAVTQMILPNGLFLVGVFFVVHSVWKFWKRQDRIGGALEAAVGIYSVLVGVRVMMETSPSPYKYALFYNAPLFLTFIVSLDQILRWAGRSLESKERNIFVGSMLVLELAVLAVMLFPEPEVLPAPFTTEYGTFYTRPDVADILPQVVSFMKSHTQNRKDILVLPEPPGFYVFAGMEAPSRWYSLLPGVLSPEQEPEFIKDIVASDVRYVLIANRALPEYGSYRFGMGYDRLIYAWIQANFRQVGQFGPYMEKALGLPYIVWIYERKDIAGSGGGQKLDSSESKGAPGGV